MLTRRNFPRQGGGLRARGDGVQRGGAGGLRLFFQGPGRFRRPRSSAPWLGALELAAWSAARSAPLGGPGGSAACGTVPARQHPARRRHRRRPPLGAAAFLGIGGGRPPRARGWGPKGRRGRESYAVFFQGPGRFRRPPGSAPWSSALELGARGGILRPLWPPPPACGAAFRRLGGHRAAAARLERRTRAERGALTQLRRLHRRCWLRRSSARRPRQSDPDRTIPPASSERSTAPRRRRCSRPRGRARAPLHHA
jgi:hypothetical protein